VNGTTLNMGAEHHISQLTIHPSFTFNFLFPSHIQHRMAPSYCYTITRDLEPGVIAAIVFGCFLFLFIVYKIRRGVKNFRTRTSMKLDKMEEQLARLESIQHVIDALPQLLEQRLRDTDFQCR
jgi:hypothetical protein